MELRTHVEAVARPFVARLFVACSRLMHVTAVAAAREMGDARGGGEGAAASRGGAVTFASPFEADDSDLLALRRKLCDCMLDCAAVGGNDAMDQSHDPSQQQHSNNPTYAQHTTHAWMYAHGKLAGVNDCLGEAWRHALEQSTKFRNAAETTGCFAGIPPELWAPLEASMAIFCSLLRRVRASEATVCPQLAGLIIYLSSADEKSRAAQVGAGATGGGGKGGGGPHPLLLLGALRLTSALAYWLDSNPGAGLSAAFAFSAACLQRLRLCSAAADAVHDIFANCSRHMLRGSLPQVVCVASVVASPEVAAWMPRGVACRAVEGIGEIIRRLQSHDAMHAAVNMVAAPASEALARAVDEAETRMRPALAGAALVGQQQLQVTHPPLPSGLRLRVESALDQLTAVVKMDFRSLYPTRGGGKHARGRPESGQVCAPSSEAASASSASELAQRHPSVQVVAMLSPVLGRLLTCAGGDVEVAEKVSAGRGGVDDRSMTR